MKPLLRFCLFIATLLIITSTKLSGQELLWTYDFGNYSGVKTSGDDTTFISQQQKKGGILRVRTGINNDGRDIRIAAYSNEIGTYSRMMLDAGATGARNIFEIYGFEATEFLYLKVTIQIRADGQNNFEVFAGTDASSGNSLNLGHIVAGIRFSIQQDMDSGHLFINKQRKSGTGTGISSAHDFNQNLVELGEKHQIEFYINNSQDDHYYYRNGFSYPLSSNQQAYWIDGVFVAAGPASVNGNHQGSPVSIGEKISVIRFLGGGVNGEVATMEIDDLIYANHFPVLRDIKGGEGWRMLAATSEDFTVETLNRQNHLQGITGAAVEGGISNLYKFDPTASDNPWITPTSTNETLIPGHGFIWYLYDNADYLPSKPLPFTLASTGSAIENDVTVSLFSAGMQNNSGLASYSWNLLGNPFGKDLKLDYAEGANAWVSGGNLMSETVQVWRSDGNYQVINAGESIAAFQGFFVHNDNALEITIPMIASESSVAVFNKDLNPFRLIQFRLSATDSRSGEQYKDEAFQIYFHPDAGHNWDRKDAKKLRPLTSRFVYAAFVGEHNGATVLKAQDSRPFNPGETISIPVELTSAAINGMADLAIMRYENIPNNWRVEIEDANTGLRQIVDRENKFKFNLTSTINPKKIQDVSLQSMISYPAKINNYTRFKINIYPGEIDSWNVLPQKMALHQNYPNPFNPATRISFDLPARSEIHLAVYDMLGREVSILKNDFLNAGKHEVLFDASNLASGIYLYRLTSNGMNITRKLTVLK